MRTKQQRALTERRIELRQWECWRRERLNAPLAGPYGEPAQALLTFLKTMTRPPGADRFCQGQTLGERRRRCAALPGAKPGLKIPPPWKMR